MDFNQKPWKAERNLVHKIYLRWWWFSEQYNADQIFSLGGWNDKWYFHSIEFINEADTWVQFNTALFRVTDGFICTIGLAGKPPKFNGN